MVSFTCDRCQDTVKKNEERPGILYAANKTLVPTVISVEMRRLMVITDEAVASSPLA